MHDFLQDKSNENQGVDFASLVSYKVVETDEEVRAAAKELRKYRVLAVDTENTGLNVHHDNPLILQVGTPDFCFNFPAYIGLDLSPIVEILEDERILKLFQNAKYDWKFIWVKYGAHINNLYCTQLAERLLTVGKPGATPYPSLQKLLYKYLGLYMEKETRNAFINRDPIAEPITEKEHRYAAADVIALFDIYYQQIAEIAEWGLAQVAKLEFSIVAPISVMEVAGVYINQKGWRDLLEHAKENYDRLAQEIQDEFRDVVVQDTLFGLPSFNIASNPQLIANLKRLGFELEDTNEATLEQYKDQHPVFGKLIEWRGWNKILSTYGEKFLSFIDDKTKRLHTNFNQLRADTGRMSSSKPVNLQNIPGYNPKDPNSLNFREHFVARPGYKLVTADFSQQELRILAELSGDENYIKAYTEKDENGDFLDVHQYTASVIFDVPYNEVTKDLRNNAKTLNYFLTYGGGPPALAQKLGVSIDEAKRIIRDYYNRYPKIDKFLSAQAKDAVNKGYSVTVAGRVRFYSIPPEDDPARDKQIAAIERKGRNNFAQGGGAEVTKKALELLYNRLREGGYDATVIMTVHDEFVTEVREDQAEEVAKLQEQAMVDGWDFFFKQVPMQVDATISDSWEK